MRHRDDIYKSGGDARRHGRRMAPARKPFERTVEGTLHYYCEPCGEYLPTACYYASTAKARRRICKLHWDKRQRRLKQGTEVASMLASLRVRLRKSPTPGLSRAWSRADVITVLRKGGYAPPYFQRDGRLCIVARDPARPLTPDNATLMRSNRCRGRHHLPTAAAQGRRRSAARR